MKLPLETTAEPSSHHLHHQWPSAKMIRALSTTNDLQPNSWATGTNNKQQLQKQHTDNSLETPTPSHLENGKEPNKRHKTATQLRQSYNQQQKNAAETCNKHLVLHHVVTLGKPQVRICLWKAWLQSTIGLERGILRDRTRPRVYLSYLNQLLRWMSVIATMSYLNQLCGSGKKLTFPIQKLIWIYLFVAG